MHKYTSHTYTHTYIQIGQATAGAMLGILLYIWATRLPQALIIIETAVVLPLGQIILDITMLGPSCAYARSSS